MTRGALLAVAALLLVACGQKNALYLPEDAPVEVPLTPEGLAAAAAAAAATRAAPADVPADAPEDDEDTRPKN